MTPREVLNELKWREDKDLAKARIWYEHRGGKREYVIISGEEITELEKGYFTTVQAKIPFYKIFRIEYEGEIVFERPQQGNP
ncbi:MAG: DUF504 domain-containing protein [Thermoplasmata archaeon]